MAHIAPMNINQELVNALVERWRSEHHTFHFPSWECTVTLEDVALHLGLPIDGEVVTRGTDFEVPYLQDMYQWLLGRRLKTRDFDGYGIRLSWLRANFGEFDA